MDWIHGLGARLRVFSWHASEEHEALLNRNSLNSIAADNQLRLVSYRRFLFGANQLAVFRKVEDSVRHGGSGFLTGIE